MARLVMHGGTLWCATWCGRIRTDEIARLGETYAGSEIGRGPGLVRGLAGGSPHARRNPAIVNSLGHDDEPRVDDLGSPLDLELASSLRT